MLYKIGEEWERGQLTIEGEHRFTAFCEQVVHLLSRRLIAAEARVAENEQIFLANAPGNLHTLGLYILRLWLEGRGHRTRLIRGDAQDVIGSIYRARPKFLLISIALPDQADRVADFVERLRAAAITATPRIVVGGYAVKVGAVTHIAGADLCPNINLLNLDEAT
jgi:methanogenic corrinoid protein MtbC1